MRVYSGSQSRRTSANFGWFGLLFDIYCGDDPTVRCQGWRLHLVLIDKLRYEAAICCSGES
jgi:hypothetical protein